MFQRERGENDHFHARISDLRRWHLVSRAITVTLVLALVATAAAQIAARRNERLREVSAATPAAGKRPHHLHGRLRHPLAGAPNAGLLAEPDSDSEAEENGIDTGTEQPPATPPIATEPAPGAVPAAPAPASPATAVHARKSLRRVPAATREPASVQRPREELTTASWEAAATALRANDRDRAEHALDALAETTDLRTRDAARLARAQLWLSQGKVDRARADLQDLAATGVTSIIQQGARDALLSIP